MIAHSLMHMDMDLCYVPKGQAIKLPFQAWLGLLDGNGQYRHSQTYPPPKQPGRFKSKSSINQSFIYSTNHDDHIRLAYSYKPEFSMELLL